MNPEIVDILGSDLRAEIAPREETLEQAAGSATLGVRWQVADQIRWANPSNRGDLDAMLP